MQFSTRVSCPWWSYIVEIKARASRAREGAIQFRADHNSILVDMDGVVWSSDLQV